MAGRMVQEQDGFSGPLTTTREPVKPVSAGDKGGLGDQALMDAILLVGLSWGILLFFSLSLRSFNI